MATSTHHLREDIHSCIVLNGGPKNITMSTVREDIKRLYGFEFVRSRGEWIEQLFAESFRTTLPFMLENFRETLRSMPDIFKKERIFEEQCRWHTEHGEILMLTKNMKEEMELHDEFLLCVSNEKDKGIAMLRRRFSDEISYLFFKNPIDFIHTYFPVVFQHPQVFEMEVLEDKLLIFSRLCNQ